METTKELLTSLGVEFSSGGKRFWPDHVKAQIVSETLLPWASVNSVALKYDIRANHLSTWRRMAKAGDLVLPAVHDEAPFAPLVVFENEPEPGLPSEAEAPCMEPVEIVSGSVAVKLSSETSAARIAQIVRALGTEA